MNLVTNFGEMLTSMYALFMRDITFPPPINSISPFEILSFLAITGILAETIAGISSRRD